MKNFLKKDYSTTRKVLICLGILLIPYASFYVYTFPLRLKNSYRNEVKVNFIYKGKEYKIEEILVRLNRGVNINENTPKFYTDWSNDGSTNNSIILDDGVKAALHLKPGFYKDGIDRTEYVNIYDTKPNPKNVLEKKYDEPFYKNLDVKVSNVIFTEKEIKNYSRFLPFFIDPQYYHDNGFLAVLFVMIFILLIVPILILYLLIAPIVNLLSNISNSFFNLFK